jgi:hypothetical protein
MLNRSYNGDPIPWFASGRRTASMLVPDWVRKVVFFIGIKKDGVFLPRATGFFVGWADGQFQFIYMVTAEHVVSGLLTSGNQIYIRLNLRDGTTREVPLPSDAWRFHPDESPPLTDVAVCPASSSFAGDAELNAIALTGEFKAVATDDLKVPLIF